MTLGRGSQTLLLHRQDVAVTGWDPTWQLGARGPPSHLVTSIPKAKGPGPHSLATRHPFSLGQADPSHRSRGLIAAAAGSGARAREQNEQIRLLSLGCARGRVEGLSGKSSLLVIEQAGISSPPGGAESPHTAGRGHVRCVVRLLSHYRHPPPAPPRTLPDHRGLGNVSTEWWSKALVKPRDPGTGGQNIPELQSISAQALRAGRLLGHPSDPQMRRLLG